MLRAQTTENAQIKSQQAQRQTEADWQQARMLFDAEQQEDLGLIAPLKKSKPWFILPRVGVRGFWTSNALLTNAGEKGDSVFVDFQGVNAGYALTPEWSAVVDYEFSLTRYSENPALDIDTHACSFDTVYRLPWNISLDAGLIGLWLYAPHQETEVYRENNPYFNVSQWNGFFDNHLIWSYGLQYDRHYAHPISYDRNEYTAMTGVSWSWLANLVTQISLRQSYQFYDQRTPPLLVNGRQEWVSTAALQTVWQPLDWLQISAFGVTSYDNSVNDTRDYKVANVGGEIRAFWKF